MINTRVEKEGDRIIVTDYLLGVLPINRREIVYTRDEEEKV